MKSDYILNQNGGVIAAKSENKNILIERSSFLNNKAGSVKLFNRYLNSLVYSIIGLFSNPFFIYLNQKK